LPTGDRMIGLFAAVHESVNVKVCGWRPHDGGAADTWGRRTQTSKGSRHSAALRNLVAIGA
jgi:hypothetical protein